MKSPDRPKVVSDDHATFAHGEKDYVSFLISRKSKQISQPQISNAAKFDVYGFIFRSTFALLVLALLFVVAIYYRIINP